jgi:hypothetical protein
LFWQFGFFLDEFDELGCGFWFVFPDGFKNDLFCLLIGLIAVFAQLGSLSPISGCLLDCYDGYVFLFFAGSVTFPA